MRRLLALSIPLLLLIAPTSAEDTIPAETVVEVKHATAFIRIEGSDWKGSGSGFVIHVNKETVLIATNAHVIAGPEFDKRQLSPPELLKSFKGNTVTAIFDSGTKAEVSAKAEVIAADQENDLAVIRVSGLKTPPKPITYTNPPAPVETMAVVTFGYPLGDALAIGKGNPAITVGKGSVSSLRNDDDGELKLIQIDASINPGNSGGPVVDTKGRLVGVVVSGYRGAQGLNFAIPAAELGKMMSGRLDGFTLTATKAADGTLAVKTEIGVLDPTSAVRSATLHYVVVPPKGTKPKAGETLDKAASVKKITLKVENGFATGELKLDKAEGDLFVQAVPDTGVSGSSRVQNFSLLLPKNANGAVVLGASGTGGPGAGEIDPPTNWKEYAASNKTYKVWIPEKCNVSSKQRTTTSAQVRLSFNSVSADTPDKMKFVVEQIILLPGPVRPVRPGQPRPLPIGPGPIGPDQRDELVKILRDIVIDDIPGATVARESDASMGKSKGKEFLIQKGNAAIRARMFVIGTSIYLLRAAGTKAQADSEDATIFLESCRLQAPNQEPNPPANPGQAGPPGNQPAPNLPPANEIGKRGPRIQGGGHDPESRDVAPEGGLLVGFEYGYGKFINNDILSALRPIYRVGDKESRGELYGTDMSRSGKVVAKPGYAVGSIVVKNGLTVDGMSITFMKVKDGKLDPKDAYESEWIGGPGGFTPARIGDGTPVVGVLVKNNDRTINGLGLIYTDTNKPGLDGAWPKGTPSRIHGGGGNPEFREAGSEGTLLVGLEIGVGRFFNNKVIKSARPIFRTDGKDAKETKGAWHGPTGNNIVNEVETVIAKPGYAIGAITAKAGLGMDGLSVTFMKVKDGKLDSNDKYESEWIGGQGGGGPEKVGNGLPVIGLIGKANNDTLAGIGLLHPAGTNANANIVGVVKEPQILGSIENDPKFKTVGPQGGVLIGLEARFEKFGNTDIVRAVRPIYRSSGKEQFGVQYGTDLTGSVTLKAKDGYAIGGITGKAGWWCNGFSLTFMKVKADGTLDPKDSYESEWVGFNGKGDVTQIMSDGTPVVGVVGKIVGTKTTALGLLFKGQEDWDPDGKK